MKAILMKQIRLTYLNRFIFILILFSILHLSVYAQSFKLALNLPSLAVNNISLQGEYVIKDNISASLGVAYNYPKGTFFGNTDNLKNYRKNIRGIRFTPEFRFYPGKQAPKGFYIGPYVRYMNYGTYWPGQIKRDSIVFVDYTARLRLTEIGIGGQLGYQFLIKEKLSIDLMIFGPRYSHYELTGIFTGLINAEEILKVVGIEGLDMDGFYGLGKLLFRYLEQKAQFTLPIDFVSFRGGLSIGYVF